MGMTMIRLKAPKWWDGFDDLDQRFIHGMCAGMLVAALMASVMTFIGLGRKAENDSIRMEVGKASGYSCCMIDVMKAIEDGGGIDEVIALARHNAEETLEADNGR